MYLWLFNPMLRFLAPGSGLGGCCVIALLWQPATKTLESPFPTAQLVCNLQHGICLKYFPSAAECQLKTFISLYFHRLLCIQVTGICVYIMLQAEQHKQVHVGIHRAAKAGSTSKGLTFLPKQQRTLQICTTRRVPRLVQQKQREGQKKPQGEEATHSKLLF